MDLNRFVKTEEDVKSALLGTILCDGSIGKQRTDGSRNGTNADLEITHTSKNLDYLRLKQDLLTMIGIESKIREHNKRTPEKTYSLYRLSTCRHPWITQLRELLYDENRNKRMPKEALDKLSELGLLFMYLDDGTLRVKCYEGTSKIREGRATFCTDRFTFSEIRRFEDYLFQEYGICTHHYRHSKNMEPNRGFRVWMNTENTNKLMSVFDKYYDLVPSMKYKFLKYYSL